MDVKPRCVFRVRDDNELILVMITLENIQRLARVLHVPILGISYQIKLVLLFLTMISHHFIW